MSYKGSEFRVDFLNGELESFEFSDNDIQEGDSKEGIIFESFINYLAEEVYDETIRDFYEYGYSEGQVFVFNVILDNKKYPIKFTCLKKWHS
jgi:hypothetical protein